MTEIIEPIFVVTEKCGYNCSQRGYNKHGIHIVNTSGAIVLSVLQAKRIAEFVMQTDFSMYDDD